MKSVGPPKIFPFQYHLKKQKGPGIGMSHSALQFYQSGAWWWWGRGGHKLAIKSNRCASSFHIWQRELRHDLYLYTNFSHIAHPLCIHISLTIPHTFPPQVICASGDEILRLCSAALAATNVNGNDDHGGDGFI